MASCTRRIRALTFVFTTILLLTPLNAIILPGTAAGSGGQNTRTPIKHVIEVMMENHSFDNMFGVYPEEIRPGGTFPAADITIPANLVSSRPSGLLKSIPVGQFSTSDPVEGYGPYHTDWNHGRMNGFANGSGPQSQSICIISPPHRSRMNLILQRSFHWPTGTLPVISLRQIPTG